MNALLLDYMSKMPENERKLALATVRPDSKLLALSLEPLLGKYSSTVFGTGSVSHGLFNDRRLDVDQRLRVC